MFTDSSLVLNRHDQQQHQQQNRLDFLTNIEIFAQFSSILYSFSLSNRKSQAENESIR